MKVIYWSGTGNTEEMAKLIAQGIDSEGKKAELVNISNDKVSEIENVVILGCPSMGAEELEEGEFRPFFDEIKDSLNDKEVVIFGSYGWGDGEWLRTWEEEVLSVGGKMTLEPFMVNNEPEGEDVDRCIDFGKEIAKLG